MASAPCQGCDGGLAQITGTFTKYYCHSDGTFHFSWEPCAPVQAMPPAPTPVPNAGGTNPAVSPLMAPVGAAAGVSGGGCGCCPGTAAPSTALSAVVAPTTTAAPCNCTGATTKRPLPWWLWLLVALGALSLVRRASG